MGDHADSFGKRRTPYAVLGFLAGGPKSGYDIKRSIENSTGHFWNESFGQIYPILKELETAGLAEAVDSGQPAGKSGGKASGRQTRRYRITSAGLLSLREWIEKPVEDVIVRNELLLKLFFGRHAEPDVLVAHLREHRRRMRRQLDTFKTYRKEYGSIEANPKLIYIIAPLDYGIRSHEAAIAWCDSTIRSLSRGARRARVVD